MASLNRIELIGCLTNYPEMRFTPSGRAVTSFTLELENDSTNMFPIQAWGRLALLCNKYLKSGSRIYLAGRLLVSNRMPIKIKEIIDGEEYELEDQRYSVRVVAKKIEFLDDHQIPQELETGDNLRIENVIRCLEALALDPATDHKMILDLISELREVDIDNIGN